MLGAAGALIRRVSLSVPQSGHSTFSSVDRTSNSTACSHWEHSYSYNGICFVSLRYPVEGAHFASTSRFRQPFPTLQMPLTREQVRSVDETAITEFGIPGVVLMENAGRGAAEQIRDYCNAMEPQSAELRSVVILCGPGNNGGDGYVIARHLERMGFSVNVVSVTDLDRLHGDARINAEIVVRSETPISVADQQCDFADVFAGRGLIVDCLLGTGARKEPEGVFRMAIEAANATEAKRVAIDIPTGLDCDSGVPSTATFQADMTVTFVDHKVGFQSQDASRYLGLVKTVGIGVPVAMLKRLPQ